MLRVIYFSLFLIIIFVSDVFAKNLKDKDIKETEIEICKPAKDNYYSDKYRGWFFKEQCEKVIIKKEEEKKEKKEKEKEDEIIIDWQKVRDPKYLDTLTAKSFQKLFNAVKDEVVYKPNHDKVLAYLEMQDYVKNKSLNFAYIWRDVLLENPRLDHTVKMPSSNYGASARDELISQHQQKVLREVKEKTGLFYFASSSCPMCSHQTPIIRRLQEYHDLTVKTISNDVCSNEMPNCITDETGILFQNFNIQQVPAIVMVVRGENDKPIFQPVGYGIQTLDEIVNRIVFYYKYRKDGKYPSNDF